MKNPSVLGVLNLRCYRHPYGDVAWAVGYMNQEPKKEVGLDRDSI
jgi:hypothetical protein